MKRLAAVFALSVLAAWTAGASGAAAFGQADGPGVPGGSGGSEGVASPSAPAGTAIPAAAVQASASPPELPAPVTSIKTSSKRAAGPRTQSTEFPNDAVAAIAGGVVVVACMLGWLGRRRH